MSLKNSREAKKLRRARKVKARNYPSFYKTIEVAGKFQTYTKLVKADKSGPIRDIGVLMKRGKLEPEVIYS